MGYLTNGWCIGFSGWWLARLRCWETRTGTDRELSCQRTQFKAYFTHLNRVLSKKTTTSVYVYATLTMFSQSVPCRPFLWNYIFSTRRTSVFLRMCATVHRIVPYGQTQQLTEVIIYKRIKHERLWRWRWHAVHFGDKSRLLWNFCKGRLNSADV